jgi:toxin FitB
MIVLDTNVLSELLRPAPAPQVEDWLSRQVGLAVYFTTVGEAELWLGIKLLPPGKRRTSLAHAVQGILEQDFQDRILSFDRAAASAYAEIAAERRAVGRPISQFDAQIAAIARANGAAVATRNVTDFGGCGIAVIDPWARG